MTLERFINEQNNSILAPTGEFSGLLQTFPLAAKLVVARGKQSRTCQYSRRQLTE